MSTWVRLDAIVQRDIGAEIDALTKRIEHLEREALVAREVALDLQRQIDRLRANDGFDWDGD